MNSSNLTIFIAELLGTFGLLIAATSCIVYDGMLGGAYGIAFIAIINFVGIGSLWEASRSASAMTDSSVPATSKRTLPGFTTATQ